MYTKCSSESFTSYLDNDVLVCTCTKYGVFYFYSTEDYGDIKITFIVNKFKKVDNNVMIDIDNISYNITTSMFINYDIIDEIKSNKCYTLNDERLTNYIAYMTNFLNQKCRAISLYENLNCALISKIFEHNDPIKPAH